MTTKTVKQSVNTTKATKPVVKGIKLDLNQILAQVWDQGLPDGISNIV